MMWALHPHNRRKTTKAVRMTTSFKTRTVKHKLNVYSPQMRNNMYSGLLDEDKDDKADQLEGLKSVSVQEVAEKSIKICVL